MRKSICAAVGALLLTTAGAAAAETAFIDDPTQGDVQVRDKKRGFTFLSARSWVNIEQFAATSNGPEVVFVTRTKKMEQKTIINGGTVWRVEGIVTSAAGEEDGVKVVRTSKGTRAYLVKNRQGRNKEKCEATSSANVQTRRVRMVVDLSTCLPAGTFEVDVHAYTTGLMKAKTSYGSKTLTRMWDETDDIAVAAVVP